MAPRPSFRPKAKVLLTFLPSLWGRRAAHAVKPPHVVTMQPNINTNQNCSQNSWGKAFQFKVSVKLTLLKVKQSLPD